MAKPKKKSRRWLRNLLLAVVGLIVFVLLFVAAFVFNPFEGTLPELRDVVPRGVNFFVRKEGLREDFDPFPEPKFWSRLTDTRGWTELASGSFVRDIERGPVGRALQEARTAVDRVRQDSQGWLDVMRDLIGREVVVAGYQMDYTQQPARPLAEPWWCCYTRVSWRVKAGLGLASFGFVQSKLAAQGVDLSSDGDLLVAKLPGGGSPIYLKRHLDVLMIANHKRLLEQSQRLIDGGRDDEPIGQMPAFTDGAQKRIQKWAEDNQVAKPNVVEFVVEPNVFDGFSRFAASWPNPNDRDSMNERVLASFLNLKGWQYVTGGLIFADGELVATGEVGLNSKQHTPFQSSFYQAEQQRREDWLDPFLAMVPESACAAAALRVPAGEFLQAMFDSLDDSEKSLLNDGMQRASFKGKRLVDTRDLIEQLKVAFLTRTGFVFRKNQPDTSRDDKGELMVPVAAKSPMPQVAWVFWLRQGSQPLVEELVSMLSTYYATFGFSKVWHLKVPFAGGKFPEDVTEFTNAKIPATGEIAMIVLGRFFIVSNSGPLVRDILRAHYSAQTGVRSIRQLPEFEPIERDLPAELNGLVWLRGSALVQVLDDYLAFAEPSDTPDQEWMVTIRPGAEEQVRRTRYPSYPSKASMPKSMTDAGGEFDQAVVAYMRDQWLKDRTNFTAEDRGKLQQMRSIATLLEGAHLQLELQNSYIRYLLRVKGGFR